MEQTLCIDPVDYSVTDIITNLGVYIVACIRCIYIIQEQKPMTSCYDDR